MTRLRPALVLAAVVVLSAGACGKAFEPSAAVVGDSEIRASEIDAAVDEFSHSEAFAAASQGGDKSAVLKDFERNYLGLLIRIAVLEPEAEARDISVTEDDIDAQIEEIKGGFPDETGFEDALKQQGLTMSALRPYVYQSELEARLRADVTAETDLSDEAIEEYYNDNIDDYTEVRSSHILVEDNQTAAALSEQLQQAPADELPDLFAELAREHSIDTTSGEDGGDLGFSNYGEFVEPFADALRDLEVGEVSRPVRTEFGTHLIYLMARRVTPLAEVEDQIVAQLTTQQQDEAWLSWVSERYAAAEVSVNPRYGEFDPESQQIVAAGPTQIPGAATPRPTPTQNPDAAPSPLG